MSITTVRARHRTVLAHQTGITEIEATLADEIAFGRNVVLVAFAVLVVRIALLRGETAIDKERD